MDNCVQKQLSIKSGFKPHRGRAIAAAAAFLQCGLIDVLPDWFCNSCRSAKANEVPERELSHLQWRS